MQNESCTTLSKGILAFIIACAIALCAVLIAPSQAHAADKIDVALTIVDNVEKNVIYNGKISSLTTDNTVRDLFTVAGFSYGKRSESEANDHLYFTNSYGIICFLNKGYNVSGTYMWLNCLNGDSGCWDEVALNEKLQANGHYQYVYDRSSKDTFEYSDACPNPLPTADTTNPGSGSGDGLIQLPTRPPAKPDPTPTEPTEPSNPGPTEPTNPGPTEPTNPGPTEPSNPGPTEPSNPGPSTNTESFDFEDGSYIASLEYGGCTYDGEYHQPGVTVTTASGEKLVEGVDYTVSYGNNKLVGNASVTIKGKGDYEGTMTEAFIIKPRPTSIRSTSSGKHYVKINYYKRTTQVTGYQVRISKYSSFSSYRSLSTTSNKTLTKTFKSLKRHTKYYVKVRTYKKVNGVKIYSNWSKTKTRYTK